MNNKGLLAVIAVVLVGIVAIFLIYSSDAETAEPPAQSNVSIRIHEDGTANYEEN